MKCLKDIRISLVSVFLTQHEILDKVKSTESIIFLYLGKCLKRWLFKMNLLNIWKFTLICMVPVNSKLKQFKNKRKFRYLTLMWKVQLSLNNLFQTQILLVFYLLMSTLSKHDWSVEELKMRKQCRLDSGMQHGKSIRYLAKTKTFLNIVLSTMTLLQLKILLQSWLILYIILNLRNIEINHSILNEVRF